MKLATLCRFGDDGTTLVLGARYNDGNGEKAGQVRVYRPQSEAMGTITDDDALRVEFSAPTGTDTESSDRNFPQLLVTGTIQSDHQVTIDAAVIDSTASGGGVDFNGPTTVTIPAGTYNTTPVAITGLSIVPDTIIEPDETIELEILPGNQVQLGDANGDGTIQATTMYTIQDDDLQNVRTAVTIDDASILTIRDSVLGGKGDQLELTIVGDRLVITDGSNIIGDFGDNTTGNAVEVPLAAILGVEIDLFEGDDNLSIDFSGTPQDLNLSVTIRGGDGHDTLTFSGSTSLGSGELITNDEVEDIFVNGPATVQSGRIVLIATESLEVNADVSLDIGAIQLKAGRDVFGNCSLVQASDADMQMMSGTGIGQVRIETNGDVTLDGGNGGIVGCPGQVAVSALKEKVGQNTMR